MCYIKRILIPCSFLKTDSQNNAFHKKILHAKVLPRAPPRSDSFKFVDQNDQLRQPTSPPFPTRPGTHEEVSPLRVLSRGGHAPKAEGKFGQIQLSVCKQNYMIL